MGAAASVPDVIDEATAKGLAGEQWNQELFDAQKDADGKITQAQFEESRNHTAEAKKKAPKPKGGEVAAAIRVAPVACHHFKPKTYRCGAHSKRELEGVIIDDHAAFVKNPFTLGSLVNGAREHIPYGGRCPGGPGTHTAQEIALWLSWGEKVSHPHVRRSPGWIRHQPPWSEGNFSVSQDGSTWYVGHFECRPDFSSGGVCSGFVSMACELYCNDTLWKRYGSMLGCFTIFGSSFKTGGFGSSKHNLRGDCGTKSAHQIMFDIPEPRGKMAGYPSDETIRPILNGESRVPHQNWEGGGGFQQTFKIARCRVVPWEDVRSGDIFWWCTRTGNHTGLVVSKLVVNGEEAVRFWHHGCCRGDEATRKYPTGSDGQHYTETAETGYYLKNGGHASTTFWFLRKIPFDINEHVKLMLDDFANLRFWGKDTGFAHFKKKSVKEVFDEGLTKLVEKGWYRIIAATVPEMDALIAEVKKRKVMDVIAAALDELKEIANAQRQECAVTDALAQAELVNSSSPEMSRTVRAAVLHGQATDEALNMDKCRQGPESVHSPAGEVPNCNKNKFPKNNYALSGVALHVAAGIDDFTFTLRFSMAYQNHTAASIDVGDSNRPGCCSAFTLGLDFPSFVACGGMGWPWGVHSGTKLSAGEIHSVVVARRSGRCFISLDGRNMEPFALTSHVNYATVRPLRNKVEIFDFYVSEPQVLLLPAPAEDLAQDARGAAPAAPTKAAAPPEATNSSCDPMAALKEELAGMKTGALNKRARKVGVGADAMDDAADEDDPNAALIALIVAATTSQAEGALKEELAGMKPGALNKRAREVGVGAGAMDDAADEDDPKAALIALIVAASSAGCASTVAGAAMTAAITNAEPGGAAITAALVHEDEPVDTDFNWPYNPLAMSKIQQWDNAAAVYYQQGERIVVVEDFTSSSDPRPYIYRARQIVVSDQSASIDLVKGDLGHVIRSDPIYGIFVVFAKDPSRDHQIEPKLFGKVAANSEYEEEVKQLSSIVALTVAETIFVGKSSDFGLVSPKTSLGAMLLFKGARETGQPWPPSLQSWLQSFDSLEEAREQLNNALVQVFDNLAARKSFCKQLDQQMREYVNGLTPAEKLEYKALSDFGSPEKLRVVLHDVDAPRLTRGVCGTVRGSEETYEVEILVQYWDHTCGYGDPFKYQVTLAYAPSVSNDHSIGSMLRISKHIPRLPSGLLAGKATVHFR